MTVLGATRRAVAEEAARFSEEIVELAETILDLIAECERDLEQL